MEKTKPTNAERIQFFKEQIEEISADIEKVKSLPNRDDQGWLFVQGWIFDDGGQLFVAYDDNGKGTASGLAGATIFTNNDLRNGIPAVKNGKNQSAEIMSLHTAKKIEILQLEKVIQMHKDLIEQFS